MESEIKGPHQDQTANYGDEDGGGKKIIHEISTNFGAPTPHKHVIIIFDGYATSHHITAAQPFRRVCVIFVRTPSVSFKLAVLRCRVYQPLIVQCRFKHALTQ